MEKENFLQKSFIIFMRQIDGKVNSAKYSDGVLIIEIPITKRGKEISLD